MIKTASTYEGKIKKSLQRAYREAQEAIKNDGLLPPIMLTLKANLEKDLYELNVKSFKDTGELIRKYIEKTKSINIRETKDLSRYEMASINYARTWAGEKAKKISSTTLEQIKASVVVGLEEEMAITEVAKMVYAKGLIESKIRAKMIARTETHSASMAGSLAMAEASEVVRMKEWISVNDDRTRSGDNSDYDHTNVDPVELREKFNVSGELLDCPGDPAGSAGNIINCRCAMAYL